MVHTWFFCMSYTELQITSNFSFLRGGSHPHELVEQAAGLGYKAVAITDHNTLAGIVRAHVAAKKAGIPCRIIVGSALKSWKCEEVLTIIGGALYGT